MLEGEWGKANQMLVWLLGWGGGGEWSGLQLLQQQPDPPSASPSPGLGA